MAYSLKKSWSFDSMRAYVVKVIAALLALKKQEPLEVKGLEALAGDWIPNLVERWRTMKGDILRANAERQEARDRLTEAYAELSVFDALWDGTVGAISGLAYLLANKNAHEQPYATLFGGNPASDLKDLGAAKASVAGAKLVQSVLALGNDQLTPLAQALEKQTKALSAAHERATAVLAELAGHEATRVVTLARLETLGHETEAEILGRFPGRKDLVRAVLDPEKEQRTPKKEPAPTLAS